MSVLSRAVHWWNDELRRSVAEMRQTRAGKATLAACLLVWIVTLARLFVMVLDWVGWAR